MRLYSSTFLSLYFISLSNMYCTPTTDFRKFLFFVLDKSWGKEYHNQRKCVDRDAGAAVRSESCRLVQDSRNAAFMVIPREQAA